MADVPKTPREKQIAAEYKMRSIRSIIERKGLWDDKEVEDKLKAYDECVNKKNFDMALAHAEGFPVVLRNAERRKGRRK